MAGKQREQGGVVTDCSDGFNADEPRIAQALADLRASGIEVDLVEHHIGYSVLYKKEKEVKK